MTDRITVWTKQHERMLQELEETGRYTAKSRYVRLDLGELAPLVIFAYEWLAANTPNQENRPEDAQTPIWISLTQDSRMSLTPGTVLLELSIDPEIVTPINIGKWGAILNYSYIPKDPVDAKAHNELLAQQGINDAKAVMTPFYPVIKRQVTQSWKRLFDESVSLGVDSYYGNIWEVRREWITQIYR
ncbi:MAG: DUF3841 domain-containing protein [Tissierellia bacterium]|nr:DUF3841 domain-containing protein [Tissierellia bacterium]